MRVFFDEMHGNYDILNMSYEELIELYNVINSCPLPQKRQFYTLKTSIDKLISMRKLPKRIHSK